MAHPTAKMYSESFRPVVSDSELHTICPTQPVIPDAPETTTAVASGMPTSSVRYTVRKVSTPNSANRKQKAIAMASRTLRLESAIRSVVTGLCSRPAPTSLSSTEGVILFSRIQSFTLTRLSRREIIIWSITIGIAMSGMRRNASRHVAIASTAPISNGPTNCPIGNPVWWVPTAKPRFSFCHHSLIMATFTGSMPPVPAPMNTLQKANPPTVRENAVPMAATMVIRTAIPQVQARRGPLPKLSPSAPSRIAPMEMPIKLSELRSPAVVLEMPNSSIIAGSTRGSITRSIEVTRIASVVIRSIHQDMECPFGNPLLRLAEPPAMLSPFSYASQPKQAAESLSQHPTIPKDAAQKRQRAEL